MLHTHAQAETRGRFRRKEYWERDDELWALQMYGDVSFHNNNIFYEDTMSTRWGEGLPQWLADEPDLVLKAFREKFPDCNPLAWVDWSHVNRTDEDDEVEVKLWICRSYGTSPVAPPDAEGEWTYLCWLTLSPEDSCPWAESDEHDDKCELCEGDDYVYFGDGYVMQVWVQVTPNN